MGANYDYLQMAEVADNVKQTVFMSGDRMDVAVPAGIFEGCDTVVLQMIGYGPGTALKRGSRFPACNRKRR